MREEEEGQENIDENLCTVDGLPPSVLGFGRVRQALWISLSVVLCEFLFALPFLCENGRAYLKHITGLVGRQGRNPLSRQCGK